MNQTYNRPQVERIRADRLIVDREVQRALDNTRVDKLVAEFDPAALGVLVVSKRTDGTLHTIDGQHRLATVRKIEGVSDELDCLVYTGLSKADEAAMFRKLNNTRTVSPLDKFRVRIIEGDKVANDINEVLVRHGWKIAIGKFSGAFNAVSAIEKVYNLAVKAELDPVAVVNDVIDVVTQAWSNNADGVRAEILVGIGQVLVRHGHAVNLPKLVEQLGENPGGPRGLVGRARAYRDARGGRVSDAMSEIAVSMLNFKRTVNRLPGWFTQAA